MNYADHILHLIINKGATESVNVCDHFITPNTDHTYSSFSFNHFEEIYQRGYDAMKAYITEHPDMFEVKRAKDKKKKK